MSLISVIIPMYNVENTIEKCLKSIAADKLQEMEIICVDNGSTDNTLMLCEKLAKGDRRIRIVSETEKGVAKARNTGLAVAGGKYIGFVDADDTVKENMFSDMIFLMEENDVDIAICNFAVTKDTDIRYRDNKKPVEQLFSTTQLLRYAFERESYHAITAWLWNKVFRRDFIDILFDETLLIGEDVEFLVRLLLKKGKVFFCDDIKYYHEMGNGNSLSRKYNPVAYECRLRAYRMSIERLEKAGIDENITIWLKRFYVFHASNFVEVAWQEGDMINARLHTEDIRLYLREYIDTNADNIERLSRIENLLAMCEVEI